MNRKPQIIAIFVFLCIVGMSMFIYLKHRQKYSFPIDMVYLWVDGSDENWLAKRKYWQQKLNVQAPYAVSAARWRDRDELKYSLRSVEKFMPWVNKIYIVTDNQIPTWLNLNHPKIKIIDHTEIFPPNALPTFNSQAIETRLSFIPGLEEHFIYANDDVFAGKPLTPDFFFTPEGLPIVYLDREMMDFYQNARQKKKDSMWVQIWDNPWVVAEKKLGIDLSMTRNYVSTHTFFPYRKSDYHETTMLFAEELADTTRSKFRSANDIPRTLYSIYDWYKNRIVLKDSHDVKKYNCKTSGVLIMKNVKDMQIKDPCSFCLNDYQNISEETMFLHTVIMKNMFPEKSSFEK